MGVCAIHIAHVKPYAGWKKDKRKITKVGFRFATSAKLLEHWDSSTDVQQNIINHGQAQCLLRLINTNIDNIAVDMYLSFFAVITVVYYIAMEILLS